MSSSTEQLAMRRALALAATPGVPLGPNPRVGCVLLAPDGEVVAEGFHRGAGTPHAEAAALADAGAGARGTTAVVTLEPCNHTGRTGPCARALVEAGVRRVVFAQADANPVAQGGAETLRAAGVEVEAGLLADEARGLNRAWTFAVEHGRPFVTWKFATSLDGRSAAADGTSRWVSGPAARRDTHRLRGAVRHHAGRHRHGARRRPAAHRPRRGGRAARAAAAARRDGAARAPARPPGARRGGPDRAPADPRAGRGARRAVRAGPAARVPRGRPHPRSRLRARPAGRRGRRLRRAAAAGRRPQRRRRPRHGHHRRRPPPAGDRRAHARHRNRPQTSGSPWEARTDVHRDRRGARHRRGPRAAAGRGPAHRPRPARHRGRRPRGLHRRQRLLPHGRRGARRARSPPT